MQCKNSMIWLPFESKMFTSVAYDAEKRMLYLRLQSDDIYRYFLGNIRNCFRYA
jgi:hypothetical protein